MVDAIPEGMALVPVTAELIDLADVSQVASAVRQIRQMEADLRDFRRNLDSLLVVESMRQGTKTLHLGGLVATVSAGYDLLWDHKILAELKEAGLPEERWQTLVLTIIEQRVVASVANQLEGASETYAAIIRRARSRVAKVPSVNVKEGK